MRLVITAAMRWTTLLILIPFSQADTECVAFCGRGQGGLKTSLRRGSFGFFRQPELLLLERLRCRLGVRYLGANRILFPVRHGLHLEELRPQVSFAGIRSRFGGVDDVRYEAFVADIDRRISSTRGYAAK